MSTKDKIVSFFSYLKIREANSIFVLQNAVPQIDFIYAFILPLPLTICQESPCTSSLHYQCFPKFTQRCKSCYLTYLVYTLTCSSSALLLPIRSSVNLCMILE